MLKHSYIRKQIFKLIAWFVCKEKIHAKLTLPVYLYGGGVASKRKKYGVWIPTYINNNETSISLEH